MTDISLSTESLARRTMLVGVGGYKGSGKDESLVTLISQYGFLVTGMSVPIDRSARMINPVITWDKDEDRPVHYIEYVDVVCAGDFTLAKEHHEVRRFLQKLGGDFGRSIDENIWADQVGQTIDETRSDGWNLAVSGIRFPNEIEMIRSRGGLLVWVSRPGFDDTSDKHITETSVSPEDFDVLVLNDGSKKQLHRRMLGTVLGS